MAKESLIRSYGRSFNGFVAKLSNEEAAKIEGNWYLYLLITLKPHKVTQLIINLGVNLAMKGVVSVFPNTNVPLHTTRSWDFMGFPQSHPISSTEGDVIIGMLDTGNFIQEH